MRFYSEREISVIDSRFKDSRFEILSFTNEAQEKVLLKLKLTFSSCGTFRLLNLI